MDSPQPTIEERIAALERRVEALDADHENRIATIEAACRAFAVLIALPRIETDRPGD